MADQTPTERAVVRDPTASERAFRVLLAERDDLYYEAGYGPLDDRYIARLLNSIKSDPVLLADLAIEADRGVVFDRLVEAGAVEQVGWKDQTSLWRGDLSVDLTDVPEWIEPLYRRVEHNGEGT